MAGIGSKAAGGCTLIRKFLQRAASLARYQHVHLGARNQTGSAWGAYDLAGGDTAVEETHFHPRRVVMYVPASDERKTNKVRTLRVDTVVFDLEDGVAVNQKENARRLVRSAIINCRSPGSLSAQCEHVVRINGVESGMLQQDLAAVFCRGSHDNSGESHDQGAGEPDPAEPHALLLPKTESVEHLLELDLSLAYHRDPSLPPLPLFILIESPTALLNLRDICIFGTREARHLRLSVLVFGSDDFIAHMGGVRTKDAQEVLTARQNIVTVAKAFDLDATDLVEIDYRDMDHLKVQAEEGYRMGYCGKQVIHPDQLPVVKAAFSPKPEQVQWASGLIEAFHEHQRSGKGVLVYQGASIDRPLLLQAQNVMNLQQAIDVIDNATT